MNGDISQADEGFTPTERALLEKAAQNFEHLQIAARMVRDARVDGRQLGYRALGTALNIDKWRARRILELLRGETRRQKRQK